jgi:hypothetical protein
MNCHPSYLFPHPLPPVARLQGRRVPPVLRRVLPRGGVPARGGGPALQRPFLLAQLTPSPQSGRLLSTLCCRRPSRVVVDIPRLSTPQAAAMRCWRGRAAALSHHRPPLPQAAPVSAAAAPHRGRGRRRRRASAAGAGGPPARDALPQRPRRGRALLHAQNRLQVPPAPARPAPRRLAGPPPAQAFAAGVGGGGIGP